MTMPPLWSTGWTHSCSTCAPIAASDPERSAAVALKHFSKRVGSSRHLGVRSSAKRHLNGRIGLPIVEIPHHLEQRPHDPGVELGPGVALDLL
jgi:hypothetical protein